VPNGGKEIYKPEFDEIVYKICAETGASNRQLIRIFGCAEQTFYDWRNKYPSFDQKLREGKDKFDSEHIEKSLVRRAKGFRVTEVIKEPLIVKTEDGQNVVVDPQLTVTKTITKVIPSDVNAIKFFLANRSPQRWKNANEFQLTGKDGGAIQTAVRHEDILDIARQINAERAKLTEGEAEFAIPIEPS
jgi:transposase-like protein